jgi:hypothetical protein
MVVDAVTIEPLSMSDFPANREKYSEILRMAPVRLRPLLKKSHKSGLAGIFPYPQEQGIFRKKIGNSFVLAAYAYRKMPTHTT